MIKVNIFEEMVRCRMMDLESINVAYRARKEKKRAKHKHETDWYIINNQSCTSEGREVVSH